MAQKSTAQKSGQLVSPGDRLGVIEEFTPNTGTFVKDGVIYASIVGRALRDLATRHLSVYPVSHEPKVPRLGSVVVGQVSSVQSDNANVRIYQIGDKIVDSVFSGVLHVSDAHIRYVDSMFNITKAGDIVRAKVTSDKNQTYHLTTRDRELGVMYAFCSRCGGTLEPRQRGMHCPKCGNFERRKVTPDYGEGLL